MIAKIVRKTNYFNYLKSPIEDPRRNKPSYCTIARLSLPAGVYRMRSCVAGRKPKSLFGLLECNPAGNTGSPSLQTDTCKTYRRRKHQRSCLMFYFRERGPFQHIAHALKYREYKSVGMSLGRHIGEVLKKWNYEVDILIPVPLHRIKQRERGYNQSEFIARGIASVIDKPVVSHAVRRTRYTQTQTKLNIEERRKNMHLAFELIPHSSRILSQKRCLLVDDVITTGATTNSCAQVIHSAGASIIIAASAALAV